MKAIYLAAALIVLKLFGLPSSAAAQNSWGGISGEVADLTQAAVPNARIQVFSRAAKDVVETVSSADGTYSVSFLAPGVYDVRVSAEGFKTLARPNVTVEAEDTVDLPLTLEIGEMSERVSVSGDREQLQTSTASRSQKFESEKVKTLPLIGRQAYNLISLTPGVLFTQEQFGANGFAGLRNWDANGKYVVNGGKEETNQFLLNGAPISLTGRWQLSPNVEAVQELRVMTNTYDAQFGRTGGGTVNTTLRGGGNAWHGAAYEFLHNAVFDANSSENNREGAGRGKHITHQFGGALGGPIRKNKDFLFLSFEGFREVAPFPVVSDTPPVDLRDGRHFTQYGLNIYDPLTTRPCREGIDTPAGTKCFGSFIRVRFPNNVIPQSRMSLAGRNILALYPAPTDPGLTQNYFATGNSGRYAYVQPIARWDHNFNDKDRLYALFTYQNGYAVQSTNGFPSPADIGSGTSQRAEQSYITEWTHVLSPSSVVDVRASFGRFTEYFPESSCPLCLTADALGIKIFPHAPTVEQNAAPRVNLDLYSSIIGNSYTWGTQNQMDLAPGMTQIHGRHVLHFGFEFVYAALGNGGPGRANGEFSFTRQWTQQFAGRNRGPLDGNGVADLLLGLPYTGFVDYDDSFYRTWPYYAGYVQDNWKIRPNLTLNLGLRYDVQVPFLERDNRVNAGFDLTAKNPLSDAVLAKWAELKIAYDAANPKYPYPDPPAALYGGRLFANRANRRPYDTDWTDVQPRLGVAWNFAHQAVLRAGFGIYHRTAADLNFSDGFSQRTSYENS
nr:TonB-dependent receptor [Acidobacteriota bacterium]